MTMVGNLGKQLIKTINDFLYIKSSMCDASMHSLCPVPVVGGELACKGW